MDCGSIILLQFRWDKTTVISMRLLDFSGTTEPTSINVDVVRQSTKRACRPERMLLPIHATNKTILFPIDVRTTVSKAVIEHFCRLGTMWQYQPKHFPSALRKYCRYKLVQSRSHCHVSESVKRGYISGPIAIHHPSEVMKAILWWFTTMPINSTIPIRSAILQRHTCWS